MIDRRSFVRGSVVAGAAAAAGARASAAPFAANSGGTADVAVVGAGAFGGWSALSLRERGLNVISLDEYGPSNPRAASAGETRSIRSGYGQHGFYSGWVIKAMALWKKRQAEFERELLFPNERIELAQVWTPGLIAQRKTFDQLRIPYEILDRKQLREKYPQMNFDDVEFAFLEKNTAAVIKARESMIRASEIFQEKGGIFRIARAMPGASNGRTLTSLKLNDGSTLSAGQFVFACGPWSPKVLPEIMKQRVRVIRSEVFFWGPPAGDDRFNCPNQPAWHDHIEGGYGFGSLGRGLKYSPSAGAAIPQDPDVAERLPTAFLAERGQRYMGLRFPAMRDAPIVEARVCQTEGTGDTNFVIDRHPDFDNVWIASGGGGHGFKFGPLVGEYLANRMVGGTSDPEIDKLFALAGRPNFTSRASRASEPA